MPTPRDLDPNYRPVKPTDERDTDETYIVHRVPFVDSAGNAGVKVHGPMPISEWAAYSKKNGL